MADPSNELTASEQIMIRALYMYAAQLLEEPHTAAEAINILHNKGLPLDSAQAIVGDLTQAADRVRRKMSRREILIGLGLIMSGLAVGLRAAGTDLAVEPSGGMIWAGITGALILFGLFWLMRGVWGIWRSRRSSLPDSLWGQSHES